MNSRSVDNTSGLKNWLLSEMPQSVAQARCQRMYLAWLALVANPIALLGLVIIVALILIAAAAPILTSGDGTEQALSDRLLPPGSEHW